MNIQRGIFLCPGNVQKSIEGNFAVYSAHEPEKHIIKIEVPDDLRGRIMEELLQMNITRETIFPGVEGFTQSLRQRYRSASRVEGMVERYNQRVALGFEK